MSMKRLVVIGLIILGLGLAVQAQMDAPPARVGAFFPVYWVLGSADSGDTGISVEDRLVVLYDVDEAGGLKSIYGYGYIKGGSFYLNPFLNGIAVAGTSYKVAIAQGPDGYGSMPQSVTVSGYGYDVVGEALVLCYGCGPSTGELPPNIKLWIGNRLYQTAIYHEGNRFIISEQPEIKASMDIDPPYALSSDINDYSITITAEEPLTIPPLPLSLNSSNMTAQSVAAAGLSAFSLVYEIQPSEKLEAGKYTIDVTAKSAGTLGAPVTSSLTAYVEVLGGPLRMVGTPITYPSPFSPSKQKEVSIQYTLSTDANIDIYVTGVGGQRVKRFLINAGEEGGSAGVNKVVWDGRSDQGFILGNAIYVGTIVARDEGKLLGRFKLTVVD